MRKKISPQYKKKTRRATKTMSSISGRHSHRRHRHCHRIVPYVAVPVPVAVFVPVPSACCVAAGPGTESCQVLTPPPEPQSNQFTILIPNGVTAFSFHLAGAGGGGGAATIATNGGGGGAGGQVSGIRHIPCQGGDRTIVVTVGRGGFGQQQTTAPGGNGGDTILALLSGTERITVLGGTAGNATNPGPGGGINPSTGVCPCPGNDGTEAGLTLGCFGVGGGVCQTGGNGGNGGIGGASGTAGMPGRDGFACICY